MKITFQQYTAIGKRPNNEDALLSDPQNGLFILCDGVGGADKGEIASELSCEKIYEAFIKQGKRQLTENLLDTYISEANKAIADHIMSFPEAKGMATTVAFLQLYDQQAHLAHIGDSRIYHIRDGEILFQTRDHSYVNELVLSGFITEEEAKIHSKKNIITRALTGNTNESKLADMHTIVEIEEGDYFLLCSDGVLEAIDESYIEDNFLKDRQISDILSDIKERTKAEALDNNSAIITKIINL